ncbi:MAG: toxin-antitoxin system HicB family antitoxin [Chloroflexi bacterium]|nr:toxin-antitoxin system HicB family antitoxin [Chloroflexota bacterium]
MPRKKEGQVTLSVRLPTELHAALTRSAEADRRSLNGQIVYAIEELLRRRQHNRSIAERE